MEANFKQDHITDKAERYKTFLRQFAPLIEGETHEISVLANTCAFFWVGFYLAENDELVLGPFQGSVACYRIKKGRGVCGTAWERMQTLVVPDVEQFPGHIACSSLSRSEIVVPLIVQGEVKGVLDIDSDLPAAFDETDKLYLEQAVRILADTIYNNSKPSI